MKKSNIIIVAFILFVVIITLVFYINDVRKENEIARVPKKEVKILPFKTLICEKNAEVEYFNSDTIRLIMEMPQNVQIPSKLYEQINDSLYLYSGTKIQVYGNGIKTIVSNKVKYIKVHPFSTDSLTLCFKGGSLLFEESESKELCINYLDIQATDSALITFYLSPQIKQLNLNINNSVINLYNVRLEQIEGQLTEHSLLRCEDRGLKEIQLQKDETSKFVLNK